MLEVENGNFEDAALRLYDTTSDRGVLCVFIKAHDSVHLSGIPTGTYELKYTTGLDWQGGNFRWLPSYNRFDQSLVYSESQSGSRLEYDQIRLTLQPVPTGTAKTTPISPIEFLGRDSATESQLDADKVLR